MRVSVIEEKLNNILENYDVVIYSVKTKREFGEKILEILLKGKELTTDLLAEIHQQLFDILEDGDLDEDYYMELSSVGAEYELTTLDEIVEHVGSYVAIDAKNYKAIGTILSVDGSIITLEYNAKGQFRKLKIEYDEVVKIGTRVKI
ncbi:MAG TPA: hypothetical protein VJ845_03675 [Haploplasma sp.]|nr:hypothetical protein [Haploplasma sp.]